MIKFTFQNLGKRGNHKITKLILEPILIPDLPCKYVVAMFRLLIDHDCLYKHLHRIGISTLPNCPKCSEDFETDLENVATCIALQNFQDITLNIGMQEE